MFRLTGDGSPGGAGRRQTAEPNEAGGGAARKLANGVRGARPLGVGEGRLSGGHLSAERVGGGGKGAVSPQFHDSDAGIAADEVGEHATVVEVELTGHAIQRMPGLFEEGHGDEHAAPGQEHAGGGQAGFGEAIVQGASGDTEGGRELIAVEVVVDVLEGVVEDRLEPQWDEIADGGGDVRGHGALHGGANGSAEGVREFVGIAADEVGDVEFGDLEEGAGVQGADIAPHHDRVLWERLGHASYRTHHGGREHAADFDDGEADGLGGDGGEESGFVPAIAQHRPITDGRAQARRRVRR